MFTISAHKKRWRIEKDNQVFFSGIGGLDTAYKVAAAHGIVVSSVKTYIFLRAIA